MVLERANQEEEEEKGRGRWGKEERRRSMKREEQRWKELENVGAFSLKKTPANAELLHVKDVLCRLTQTGRVREGGPLQGSLSLLTLLFHLDEGKTSHAGLLYHAHTEQMPTLCHIMSNVCQCTVTPTRSTPLLLTMNG